MTDIAGLCERLRRKVVVCLTTDKPLKKFVNPDGPKAADTIERQADEIKRLRLALVEAGMRIETCPGADESRVKLIVQKIRAALTGEDAPQPPNNERTG
jgi:hypothetical protein